MTTTYDIKLLAQDKKAALTWLPIVPVSYDQFSKGAVSVEFGSCAVVEYDCLVKKDGSPIGAICSEDPYFYLKTAAVLRYGIENV